MDEELKKLLEDAHRQGASDDDLRRIIQLYEADHPPKKKESAKQDYSTELAKVGEKVGAVGTKEISPSKSVSEFTLEETKKPDTFSVSDYNKKFEDMTGHREFSLSEPQEASGFLGQDLYDRRKKRFESEKYAKYRDIEKNEINPLLRDVHFGFDTKEQLRDLYNKPYGKKIVSDIVSKNVPELNPGIISGAEMQEKDWDDIAFGIQKKNRINYDTQYAELSKQQQDIVSNIKPGLAVPDNPTALSIRNIENSEVIPEINIQDRGSIGLAIERFKKILAAGGKEYNGVNIAGSLIPALEFRLSELNRDIPIGSDISSDEFKTKIGLAIDKIESDYIRLANKEGKLSDISTNEKKAELVQRGLEYYRSADRALFNNATKAITDLSEMDGFDYEKLFYKGQELENDKVILKAATDESYINKETSFSVQLSSSLKARQSAVIGEFLKRSPFRGSIAYSDDVIDWAIENADWESAGVDKPTKEMAELIKANEDKWFYDEIPKSGIGHSAIAGAMEPILAIARTGEDLFSGSVSKDYLRSKKLDRSTSGGQTVIDEKGELSTVLPSDKNNFWFDIAKGAGSFITQMALTKGFGAPFSGVAKGVFGASKATAATLNSAIGTGVSSYLQAYGDAYENVLQRTGDPTRAMILGNIEGAIAFGTEQFLIETKVGSKIFKNLTGDVSENIYKIVKSGGTPAEKIKKVASKLKNFARSFGDVLVQENFDEVGGAILNRIAEAIVAPEMPHDTSLMNEIGQTIYSTSLSMAFPSVLSGVSAAKNRFTRKVFNTASLNLPYTESTLRKQLTDGKVSQDEYNSAISLLTTNRNNIISAPKTTKDGKELSKGQRQEYGFQQTEVMLNEKKAKEYADKDDLVQAKIYKDRADAARAVQSKIIDGEVVDTFTDVAGKLKAKEFNDKWKENISAIGNMSDDEIAAKHFSKEDYELWQNHQLENPDEADRMIDEKREQLKEQEDLRHAKEMSNLQKEDNDAELLNKIKSSGKLSDVEKGEDLQYFIDKAGEAPLAAADRFGGDEVAKELISRNSTERLRENHKFASIPDSEEALELDRIIGEREDEGKEVRYFNAMAEEVGESVNPILQRMNDADYINEKELDEAADNLYEIYDEIEKSNLTDEQKQSSINLIEPLITKIEGYEFRTKTEVGTTTETEATIVPRQVAKREVKPALQRSEGSAVTVTKENGAEVSGVLKKENGKYVVINEDGNKAAVLGEVASTDIGLSLPEEMENPVELDQYGRVSSITFKTKKGDLVKITNPDTALDLAIQLKTQMVGEVPQQKFDLVFNEVQRETRREVLANQEATKAPAPTTAQQEKTEKTNKSEEPKEANKQPQTEPQTTSETEPKPAVDKLVQEISEKFNVDEETAIRIKEVIDNTEDKADGVKKIKKILDQKRKLGAGIADQRYDNIEVPEGIDDEVYEQLRNKTTDFALQEKPILDDIGRRTVGDARTQLEDDGGVVWQNFPNTAERMGVGKPGRTDADAIDRTESKGQPGNKDLHNFGFGADNGSNEKGATGEQLQEVLSGEGFSYKQRGMAAAYIAALRLLNNQPPNFIGRIFQRASNTPNNNRGRIRIMYSEDPASPIMAAGNGAITLNAYKLGQRLKEFGGEKRFASWMEAALQEEVIHLATQAVATEKEFQAVADEMTDEQKQRVSEIYGKDLDKISDYELAGEFVRMVFQERVFGTTTELLKPSESAISKIKKIATKLVAFIKQSFSGVENSKAKDIVSRLERFAAGEEINRNRAKEKRRQLGASEQDQIKALNLQTLKNISDEYKQGLRIFKRFSQKEQRGFTSGGEINVEASILLAADEGTGAKNIAENEAQENRIEQYAKKEGIWVDDTTSSLTKKYGEPIGSGEEAIVWGNPKEGTVVKTQDTFQYDNLQQKLDGITLHNSYFPAAPLKVIGFGRNTKGEFQVIVEQPFVQGEKLSISEIRNYVESIGLKYDAENDNYRNSEIILEDLHTGNAIKDKDGNIIVIDPIMRLNTPEIGYGGKRIVGTFSNETGNILFASDDTTGLSEGEEALLEALGDFWDSAKKGSGKRSNFFKDVHLPLSGKLAEHLSKPTIEEGTGKSIDIPFDYDKKELDELRDAGLKWVEDARKAFKKSPIEYAQELIKDLKAMRGRGEVKALGLVSLLRNVDIDLEYKDLTYGQREQLNDIRNHIIDEIADNARRGSLILNIQRIIYNLYNGEYKFTDSIKPIIGGDVQKKVSNITDKMRKGDSAISQVVRQQQRKKRQSPVKEEEKPPEKKQKKRVVNKKFIARLKKIAVPDRAEVMKLKEKIKDIASKINCAKK